MKKSRGIISMLILIAIILNVIFCLPFSVSAEDNDSTDHDAMTNDDSSVVDSNAISKGAEIDLKNTTALDNNGEMADGNFGKVSGDSLIHSKIEPSTVSYKTLDFDAVEKQFTSKEYTYIKFENTQTDEGLAVTGYSPDTVFDADYNSVHYSLNIGTGAVVITGTGDAVNIWYDGDTPLHGYMKSVYIGEGITSIGDYSFMNAVNLSSVSLPSTITSIGFGAFANCTSLSSANLYGDIGDFAFYKCDNLKNVSIKGNCNRIGESAFSLDISLDSIEIPDGCDRLDVRAFAGCFVMNSITLPSSIRTIGDYCFYSCKELQSVVISEGTESIGTGCFGGDEENGFCNKLTEVTLPSTLNYLGDFAFENCSSLQRVNMPVAFSGSITEIRLCTFMQCISLKSITIPSGITTISKEAFVNCQSLGNVSLPDGLTEIGEMAFHSCAALKNITLPMTLSEMGAAAFYRCSSLEQISIPDRIKVLNKAVFYECTSLKNVTLSNNIEMIDTHVFKGCTSLKMIVLPDKLKDIRDFGFGMCENLTIISLPDTLTEIGEGAFLECHNLVTVTMPEGMTTIKNHAFFDCTSLKNIRLPDSLQELGECAFTHCVSLESIAVPAGITELNNALFMSCEKLGSVQLSGPVTVIGDHAFSGCYLLESVNIPSSVDTIGERAFISCEALQSIDLPEGLRTIGTAAFTECLALKTLRIPSTVNSIGDYALIGLKGIEELSVAVGNPGFVSRDNIIYSADMSKIISVSANKDLTGYTIPQTVNALAPGAFYYNQSLEKLTVPEAITVISARAFYGCSKLEELILHDKITSLGDYSVSACPLLKSLDIPSSVTEIGEGVICGDASIKEIVIPEGIQKIPAFFANSCKALETVTIPQSVTEIGGYAFAWDDSLINVSVPSGLSKLGEGAFAACSSLTSITIPAGIEYIDAFVFNECEKLTSIYFEGALFAIGNFAFLNDTSLKEVVFSGDAPETIGEKAFDNASDKLTFYFVEGSQGWTHPEWTGPDGNTYHTDSSVSGKCGNEAKWTFSSLTGILTISGTGKMYSWDDEENVPWNEYAEEIKTVIVEEGITEVGSRAFMGCPYLETATIADSVEQFGYGVFAYCYCLGQVISPNGLHMVSQAMFYNCYRLYNVLLSEDLTTIDNYAFYCCSEIEAIIIPEGVSQILEGTFADCKALYTVRFLGDVSKIETGAFFDCNNLEILCFYGDVPSDVHSFAFCGVPDNMIVYSQSSSNRWTDGAGKEYLNIDVSTLSGSCGANAVWCYDPKTCLLTVSGTGKIDDYEEGGAPWSDYCELICGVMIESGITEIGEYSFCGMSSLLQATIPDTVVGIGKYAFAECVRLYDIQLSNNIGVIGEGAFMDCSSLTEMTVPAGVSVIEPYTFSKCSQLHHVSLPGGITSIGYAAFYYCLNLEELVIPGGLQTIGDWAFAHCITITDIDLSANVTSIGEFAFNDCRTLKSVTMGTMLTDVGKFAFSESGLTSVVIPSQVTGIKEGVFANCRQLSMVTLNNTKDIGDSVFYGCSALAGINVDNIVSIGEKAFMSSGLKTVDLPVGITTVGIYAFADCDSLKTITSRSEKYTVSDNILYDGKTLLQYPSGKENTSFKVNKNTASIAEGAFYGADKLVSVTLSDDLDAVGKAAFACCPHLKNVTIGMSITTINDAVFGDCTSLSNVYFLGDAPSLGKDVFYGSADDMILYYKDGAEGWTYDTWIGSDQQTYHTQLLEGDAVTMTLVESDPGSVTVRILIGRGAEECNAKLIFAMYRSDGKFIGTRQSDINIKETSTEFITTYYNLDESAAYGKAMLVDAKSHIPLTDYVYKDIAEKPIRDTDSDTSPVGFSLPKDNTYGSQSISHEVEYSVSTKADFLSDPHEVFHAQKDMALEKQTTRTNYSLQIDLSTTVKESESSASALTIPLYDREGNEVGETSFSKVTTKTELKASWGGYDAADKEFDPPNVKASGSFQYSVVDENKEIKSWRIGDSYCLKISQDAQVLNAEAKGTIQAATDGLEVKAEAGVDVAKAGVTLQFSDTEGNSLITIKTAGKVGAGAGVKGKIGADGKVGAGIKGSLGIGGEVEVEVDLPRTLAAIYRHEVDSFKATVKYITETSTKIADTINGIYNEYSNTKTQIEIAMAEAKTQEYIDKTLARRNRVTYISAWKDPNQPVIKALPAIYRDGPSISKMPPDCYISAAPAPAQLEPTPVVPAQTSHEEQQGVAQTVTLTREQELEILKTVLLPSLLGYSSRIGIENAINSYGPVAVQIVYARISGANSKDMFLNDNWRGFVNSNAGWLYGY